MTAIKAEMLDDLVERMRDDIVQFAELYGAALRHYPHAQDAARAEIAVEVVMRLIASGQAKVGDVGTDESDGLLDVFAWPERGEALRERLRAVVRAYPRPGLGDGFWLSRLHEKEVA